MGGGRLWDSAAAAFDLLSADPVAGLAADRNVGLCRLWLGDQARPRRPCAAGSTAPAPTPEAVDLAVVCQLIDESTDKEPIEQVRLSWPLRDRQALLKTLEAQPTVVRGEHRHLDPEDDESPEVECFHWLDRPGVEPRSGPDAAGDPARPGGHPDRPARP